MDQGFFDVDFDFLCEQAFPAYCRPLLPKYRRDAHLAEKVAGIHMKVVCFVSSDMVANHILGKGPEASDKVSRYISIPEVG